MQPARRRCFKPANAASMRGIAAALAVLYDTSGPAMTTEEALAERERFRREAEASQRRQGELALVLKVSE
ncbi:TPA: hypothetical protein QEM98_000448 [Stenotrophomonas maltophilia]|nr:hypothetical protein [Stenotrophomonas maltophilia]